MAIEIRTRLYITTVSLAAAAVLAATVQLWHVQWDASLGLLVVLVAGLVFLGARYPFRLSPQAEASLFTVPLFMGLLLLHPAQAAAAGALGLAGADLLNHRPLRAVLFNAGVSAVMAGAAGMVFWALQADGMSGPLFQWQTVAVALVAGAVLHFTNIVLMAGMVTLRKGMVFWKQWKETWAIDLVQEGGALVLGFAAALLVTHVAVWTVLLLVVPLALAYHAFRRSVEETTRSLELSQQLEAKLAELQEAQAQLVVQSEKLASVGIIAASVVHEVKNAMTVTAGRAELLMRNSDRYFKNERAIEHVNSIYETTRRVTTIVQELLAYSRPNTSVELVKVSDAMEIAADLVGKQAISKGIGIEREYENTPPVEGVANQLQQVFVNLIMNSIDATPAGGRITLRCSREGEHVVATVRDTGAGIPRDVLAQMFQPFLTTKDPGKGNGLGMFVCHRIVTRLGGEIAVNSEEGAGTEVVIRLPIAATEERPAQDPVIAEAPKQACPKPVQNEGDTSPVPSLARATA